MAECPKIPSETLSGEDIYPDLPPLIVDKIMKYHRLANVAFKNRNELSLGSWKEWMSTRQILLLEN